MKRDIIQEIINKRSRNLRRIGRVNQYFRKYTQIMDAYLFLEKEKRISKNIRDELFRYVPIGIITAVENYYRALIRDLLLKGNPFGHNITSLNNINIDFKSIINAQVQKLSIPDLISHYLPLSNIDEINFIMSKLLDCDFLSELKTEKVFGYNEQLIVDLKVFVEASIRNTKRAFELRNIFCHELAFNYRISIRELKDVLVGVHSFILFTELYLHNNILKN